VSHEVALLQVLPFHLDMDHMLSEGISGCMHAHDDVNSSSNAIQYLYAKKLYGIHDKHDKIYDRPELGGCQKL
jgi:hypothetical protein